ncbi:hypothetical protein AVEN_30187-1 [Araneus ventricosus]|uniref:Uncharacterized protein n=1 Tax=Araneus ventricosus TaxID=182803 RepID=A0A4Y2DR98_ARAVE|nr:hypothetical protein AVEN_30187-1 [Araneus ventricosus]
MIKIRYPTEYSIQETLPKPRLYSTSERPAATTANGDLWSPQYSPITSGSCDDPPPLLQGHNPSPEMGPKSHTIITISHQEARLLIYTVDAHPHI